MVQCQIRWNMIPAFQEFKWLRWGLTEWHPKSNKSQHNGKHSYLKGGSLEILNMSSSMVGMGSGMESYRTSGCHADFFPWNSAVELMLQVHSPCASNIACVSFMQEQSHISQLQYSMASTDAASYLKLFSSSEQGSDIFHCSWMRNKVTGHRGFEQQK